MKNSYKPASSMPSGLNSKRRYRGNKDSTQAEFASATARVKGQAVNPASLPGQNVKRSK